MITKRIIPCLDVRDGRVVKGTNFQGHPGRGRPGGAGPDLQRRRRRRAGLLRHHRLRLEGRSSVHRHPAAGWPARSSFPLTVGGGIRTLEDFDRVLKCGADKVSASTPGAICRTPASSRPPPGSTAISAWCSRHGRQAGGTASSGSSPRAGSEDTGIGTPWTGAVRGVAAWRRGDLSSIQHRHRRRPAPASTSRCWTPSLPRVHVPIVASGGAGREGGLSVSSLPTPRASTQGLAAAIFHTRHGWTIHDRKTYLNANGVEMRL